MTLSVAGFSSLGFSLSFKYLNSVRKFKIIYQLWSLQTVNDWCSFILFYFPLKYLHQVTVKLHITIEVDSGGLQGFMTRIFAMLG